MILAIDPGPTESAFVVYEPATRTVHEHGKRPNAEVLARMRGRHPHVLVIEMIASYGMPVGREVFETCVVIGRMLETWKAHSERVTRGAVKLHLCGSMRAKDGNVRAALIDLFGGKDKAIGSKAKPGPLHGVSGDVWSALAVAVTYADIQERARAA